MFVVDLFGRRPLLLASGLVMSASTAAVGAFFAIDPEKRVDITGPIQYYQLHTCAMIQDLHNSNLKTRSNIQA